MRSKGIGNILIVILMNNGIETGFFSDFVLIFPPTIFEIGQAVPEMCISKAPLLVRKELLG